MWESRRDFQRVWEGWEAGIMAFHAFHTLSFPWPALRRKCWIPLSDHGKARTGHETLVLMVVNECIGDLSHVQMRYESFRTGAATSHRRRLYVKAHG
jgi:hypothetical protein